MNNNRIELAKLIKISSAVVASSSLTNKQCDIRQRTSLRKLIKLFGLLLLFTIIRNPVFPQIAVRGSATSSSTTNASLTISKPSGVVVGDIMIMNISRYYSSGSNSCPTSTGWTQMVCQTLGGNWWGGLMYRVVDGTEGTSFTFSLTNNNYAAGSIVAFSGVNPSSPFDVTPGTLSTQTASTSVSATSIATVTNNAAIIMFGMASSSPYSSFSGWSTTSPGSLTEIYDNGGATYQAVGAAWAIKTTAGSTGAGSATISSSGHNGGILIALKPCTPPSAPSTTGATICSGSTAVLSASGAVSGDKYKWYDAASGGNLLKTSSDYNDNTYTTPSLTSTTNYWVSIINSSGCESSRTQVTATVSSPAASVTSQSNISCFAGTDGSITISASGGIAPYQFSVDNGQNYTSGSNPCTISGLSANVQYKIRVKDSIGCESPQIP
jgi:hypothetical protein